MSDRVPTASYQYKAVHCKTAKDLDKLLEKHRHDLGFYIYGLNCPTEGGIIAVIARADQQAMKLKAKPKIDASLKPYSEEEAKQLLNKCDYLRTEDLPRVDNFITWLYENSYRILREVKE